MLHNAGQRPSSRQGHQRQCAWVCKRVRKYVTWPGHAAESPRDRMRRQQLLVCGPYSVRQHGSLLSSCLPAFASESPARPDSLLQTNWPIHSLLSAAQTLYMAPLGFAVAHSLGKVQFFNIRRCQRVSLETAAIECPSPPLCDVVQTQRQLPVALLRSCTDGRTAAYAGLYMSLGRLQSKAQDITTRYAALSMQSETLGAIAGSSLLPGSSLKSAASRTSVTPV